MRTKGRRAAARELINKLEALAAAAEDELDDYGPGEDRILGRDFYAERLEERATNYRHAAELATGILEVRR